MTKKSVQIDVGNTTATGILLMGLQLSYARLNEHIRELPLRLRVRRHRQAIQLATKVLSKFLRDLEKDLQ